MELRKVRRIDQIGNDNKPKKIELTHVLGDNGFETRPFGRRIPDGLIYLGHCCVDGDIFMVNGGDAIIIYKGNLNDGVY